MTPLRNEDHTGNVPDVSETFTKLFSSIVSSTVWAEDSDTKVVWVTLLAMSDRHGYVGGSIPGVARIAGVSVEACEAAIAKFLGPDPYSRSKEYEGRRIEVADRGWILLNYQRFRDMRDEEARKEYERNRKAEARARARESVPDSPAMSPDVPGCPAVSAQAEADAYADVLTTEIVGRQPADSSPAPSTAKAADPRSEQAKATWLRVETHRVQTLGGKLRKPSPAKLAKAAREILALAKHVRDTEGVDVDESMQIVEQYGIGAIDEAAADTSRDSDRLRGFRSDWHEWRSTRFDVWRSKLNSRRDSSVSTHYQTWVPPEHLRDDPRPETDA